MGELAFYLMRVGRWSESLELIAQVPQEQGGAGPSLPQSWTAAPALPHCIIEIAGGRGDRVEAQRVLSMVSAWKDSADVQDRWGYVLVQAKVHRVEGQFEDALGEVLKNLEAAEGDEQFMKVALGEGLESALALGRFEMVEELLARIEAIPPGARPPSLRAQAARFRARLAAARGEEARVEQSFKTAEAVFREHSLVFHMAVAELEHAEWLVAQGRAEDAEPLLGRRARSSSGSRQRPGSSAATRSP